MRAVEEKRQKRSKSVAFTEHGKINNIFDLTKELIIFITGSCRRDVRSEHEVAPQRRALPFTMHIYIYMTCSTVSLDTTNFNNQHRRQQKPDTR